MDPEMKKRLDEIMSSWSSYREKSEGTINDLAQRLDDLETRAARPTYGGSPSGRATPEQIEHVRSFERFIRKGETDELLTKSLNTGTDSEGGYAVPEVIDHQIENFLVANSPIRQIARVVKFTGPGEYYKLVNKRGTVGGWVGETDARPETTPSSLARISFPNSELYANPASSQQFLDSAMFDAGQWIETEIAEKFSQLEGAGYVNGAGGNEPEGFLSYTMSTDDDDTRTFGEIQYNLATGTSGVLDQSDDLITLLHTLKPGYRANATWVMNDATLAAIRKLKDSQDRYLWVPGLQARQPDRLLGYPVLIAADMPDVAAGANAIAFGDFKRGYTIVDRPTRILRDPYTNKPYVHFYATKRVSGALINSQAIKILRMN